MKIIKPLTPYTHKYGDFIYGHEDFLGKFHKSMLSKENIHLTYLNTNTWNALKTLGITNSDEVEQSTVYECPYTGIKYNAVAPIAVLTDNAKKYVDPKLWYFDMACDQQWNQTANISDKSLNNVMYYQLGPGYIYECNMHDGSASTDLSTLDLDNGDIIICANKVWHNK